LSILIYTYLYSSLIHFQIFSPRMFYRMGWCWVWWGYLCWCGVLGYLCWCVGWLFVLVVW
jgi:hypothetical protein